MYDLFSQPDLSHARENRRDNTAVHIHSRENNSESQSNLNSNKKGFEKQCNKLEIFLMSGGRVDSDSAKEMFGIRHLPRRKKDLTDSGIKITGFEWVKKLKVIFMTEEDKEYNRKLRSSNQ